MGRLYLIPAPLGDNDPREVIPGPVLERACSIGVFVVEELRTARRFLSSYGLKGRIDGLEFHLLNEHTAPSEVEALAALFRKGDVGLITEAGLPAVADPGSALVALAHREGVEVVPLPGPSSLMLALMASGLNGQSFAFRGYVPAKTELRREALKNVERTSASLSQSQIIIETPYRNDALFRDMLEIFAPSTSICVAADLTLPSALVRTMKVADWRKTGLEIGRRPCVFVVLASR
ncbi:MAG: SAM-dependent methyltransferase [Bacteroidales bacterium]|nr:SAM-dependent methyltransferase [Bacteroidales bacterium]